MINECIVENLDQECKYCAHSGQCAIYLKIDEKKAFKKAVSGKTEIKRKDVNGQLILDDRDVIEYDKPFALLQSVRYKMVRDGYSKARLKIRYLDYVVGSDTKKQKERI